MIRSQMASAMVGSYKGAREGFKEEYMNAKRGLPLMIFANHFETAPYSYNMLSGTFNMSAV